MSPGLLDGAVQRRFWAQVGIHGDACWLWHLAHNQQNYGMFTVSRGHQISAHRMAYISLIGPLPDGVVLDHLCRNHWCVNPFHLDPVSQRENILRGQSPAAWHAHKRFCPHGHRYDAANTYHRRGGGRACRACKRLGERRRRAQRQTTRSMSTRSAALVGGGTGGTRA